MIRKILVLAMLPVSLLAAAFPEQQAVPGGIVKLAVGDVSDAAPKVFFNDQRVLVAPDQDQWIALVGIPLSTQVGEHSIDIVATGRKQRMSFAIEDKHYPEQRLTITKKRMVTGFTKEDLEKINADKIALGKAKSVWSENKAETGFIVPVEGRLSSLFGLKRFFNDIPKRPHNGLDLAAPIGTPILAPAAGTVINTGSYYFNGNTVFLDHGQGLLSAYLHMHDIAVKAGQQVRQGEQLGTVGSTGRVTGPHLHWIIYLNKTEVDPALFIAADMRRLQQTEKKE